MSEMGIDPEKLRKVSSQNLSKEELKRLIKEAIEESPLPVESRKSVLTHLYDAMTVIGTGYGFWQFLQALMIFVTSFTMSAEEKRVRTSPEERALEEAQALVFSVGSSLDGFSIARILRMEIESVIEEGIVASGQSVVVASILAKGLSLHFQHRLFIPGHKIVLDERSLHMLKFIMSEHGVDLGN